MNTVNPALQPFLTVSLPIMVTLITTISLSSWSQNKRFDNLKGDMNRRFDDASRDTRNRFDDVIKRLDRIEIKLDNHEQRIVRLEERTSPLHR